MEETFPSCIGEEMNGLGDHFCKCPEHLVMALVVVVAAGQDSERTLFQHKEGRKAFLLPISKVSSTAWTRHLMEGSSSYCLADAYFLRPCSFLAEGDVVAPFL